MKAPPPTFPRWLHPSPTFWGKTVPLAQASSTVHLVLTSLVWAISNTPKLIAIIVVANMIGIDHCLRVGVRAATARADQTPYSPRLLSWCWLLIETNVQARHEEMFLAIAPNEVALQTTKTTNLPQPSDSNRRVKLKIIQFWRTKEALLINQWVVCLEQPARAKSRVQKWSRLRRICLYKWWVGQSRSKIQT